MSSNSNKFQFFFNKVLLSCQNKDLIKLGVKNKLNITIELALIKQHIE